MNTDESRTIRSKTPTTGTGTFSPHFPLTGGATTKALNKPSSTTPLPRLNNTTNNDENDPNNDETTAAALVPTLTSKRHVIKKRSSTLVRFLLLIFY
jgi:hypothetical protein